MCTWKLTGKLKGKICPLVKTLYGFEDMSQTSSTKNQEVVAQLKMSLGFCYKVSHLHRVCADN